MSRYRRVATIFGLVGLLVPIAIFLVDWLLRGWFPEWVFLVWPTSILLLPYPGYGFDAERGIVFILSAVINAAIYAALGAAVRWVLGRFRSSGSNAGSRS